MPKLNSPMPVNLAGECTKAAKIFSVDVSKGLDGVIPSSVLQQARGFAIFTVVKAGFLFSARAGTGVVIARLDNGTWSAPSAIGTTGIGFGGQAGAEITDFIIVLNSRSAVKTFMSAGSLTLGGNMSVAIGPMGRNAEGSGALNTKGKVAAMYSYSKTKGLFGGISIEGSVIVERSDANAKAYHADVSAKQLLTGQVDVPPFAEHLIEAISNRAGTSFDSTWIDDSPMPSPGLSRSEPASSGRNRGYSFGSANASISSSDANSTRARSGSLLSRPSFSPRWSFRKGGADSPKLGKGSERDYFEQDRDRGNYDRYESGKGYENDYGNARDRAQSFDLSDDDRNYRNEDSYGDFDYKRGRSGTVTAGSKKTYDFDDQDEYPIIQIINKDARGDSFDEPSYKQYSRKQSDPFGDDHQARPRQSIDSASSDITDPDNPDKFNFNGLSIRQDKTNPSDPTAISDLRNAGRPPLPARTGTASDKVVALYDFISDEPGDLPFAKDDVITIVRRPPGEEWWVGKYQGREGIFPSNYVQPL